MKNKFWILSLILLVVFGFSFGKKGLNLSAQIEYKDGNNYYFKINEKLKGKILYQTRSNGYDGLIGVSFWVDSADMHKIPRDAGDFRWPWFGFQIDSTNLKKINYLTKNNETGCSIVEANVEIFNYTYTKIQSDVSDGAEMKILNLGKTKKLSVDSCEVDLKWYQELINRKIRNPE